MQSGTSKAVGMDASDIDNRRHTSQSRKRIRAVADNRSTRIANWRNKMHTRQQIIEAARRKDPDIGDDAMISASESGYWVAVSIFVRKTDITA